MFELALTELEALAEPPAADAELEAN